MARKPKSVRRLIVTERNTRRTSALVDMRRRIVEGEFGPGDRLPTRTELVDFYDTSPVTIQRVFDTLIAEGFVRPRGRAGTFVTEKPPHLAHYVVFFPPSHLHSGPEDSLMWRAIVSEAKAMAKRNGCKVSVYDWGDAVQDAEKNLEFINDVLESRVAGLIFPTHPAFFMNLPIMHVPGVPRIALSEQPIDSTVIAVSLAGPYLQRALDHFQEAGRKRLAVLGSGGLLCRASFNRQLERETEKRDMTCPQIWRHSVDLGSEHGAHNLTRLLFSGKGNDRPDAFLIMDDNLVDEATKGLAATELTVPDDVAVVAHCNFPHPPASAVPVTHLGYDISKVLALCIDLIDKQRQDEPVPDLTVIDPLFENELE